ncbi:hypothetical protein EAH74_23165 [Pseudomonas mandelii]|uniref:Uncharacterized protein n=1 Tax=Pseudomonas mandelii TaxID=75612 RepID=A0A502I398_9PSED|nr:hypothetical protein EAH74_23165 [Pseudomonas mandelii]
MRASSRASSLPQVVGVVHIMSDRHITLVGASLLAMRPERTTIIPTQNTKSRTPRFTCKTKPSISPRVALPQQPLLSRRFPWQAHSM